MIPRQDVLIGNLTHVGMERSENQDYYGYYEPEDDRDFETQGRLIIVCDGMGGHAGGEVASRLAVNTMIEVYKNDKSGNVAEALRKSIEQANKAIWEYAAQKPELKGMGSTAVALALKDGQAYFGHVGDSRCYLIRNEQLIQATRDHSLVQQMVDEGLLQESEMENHPEKNVILRSLGVKPEVEVEVNSMPYQVDDIFLLSTDGLTGLVSKEECLRISLLHKDNPMEGARLLVDLANKYGGYDNVTVQMVRVRSMNWREAPKPPKPDSTTALFTQEDVQRSIAEARAKAQASVKSGPSAAEMLGNIQKKAPPQKGITTALAAPTKEELEAAKQEAMARAAAAQAAQSGRAPSQPASGAPAKGGVKMLAVVIVAVVTLVGGLVVGNMLSQKTSQALADLARAEARAEHMKGTDKHRDALKKAQAAKAKASGLFGFMAVDEVKAATKELEALSSSSRQSSSATTSDDAERAKKLMQDARPPKELADLAPVERDRAEAARTAGDKALEEKDYAAAVEYYAKAREGYRECAEKAAAKQAAKKLEEVRDQAAKELTAASLYAKDYFPELIEDAKSAIAEADAAMQTDPVRALDRATYAAGLLRGANRFAVDFEKKN